jgi:hypothetical protein
MRKGFEELNNKVGVIGAELSDTHNRVNDLEADTITRREFEEHKRIGHSLSPALALAKEV